MREVVQLAVESPRGTITLEFDKTTKVAEVIETARDTFGFEPGGFLLRRKATDDVLAPERPLVSYHIENGEAFLLVPEMGSGV